MKKILSFFESIPTSRVIIFVLIVALFSTLIIFKSEFLLFKNNTLKEQILGSSEDPTTTITLSSTPIPTLITEPTKIQQKYIAPVIDTDPPVHCKIHANCGGGTTPLKQSECNNSTCCQVGGKWIFYKDKNQCAQDQNKYSGSSSSNTTNTYTSPSSTNPNEVTCSVIGYSQSRKVWTYILTPEECTSAKTNYTQPTTSSKNILIDCTIDGKVVGNMTYAECSQKITEYYQAKITPIHDTSAQDYNNAVSACLNRMRALGAANSSQAQACYGNPNLGL